ncbi:MAG: acyl-CoA dehydrogenase [Pseudomonadota bacterium]
MSFFILILALIALAYVGAPAIGWVATLGVATIYYSFFADAPVWLAIMLWVLYIPTAVFLCIPRIRQRVLTKPIFSWYRKVLPPLSETEREAMEAGDVSWDGELFTGKPNWDLLLEQEAPKYSPEELAFLQGPVNDLCRMLDDWKITHESRDLPEEVWSFLKREGFFGMIIPKKFGGHEFSAHAHSSIVMKIATRSISAAVTVMVPNSLGPAELLLHYGTPRQQDYYLPRLVNGDEIPCFALTGPVAGSDAGALTDSGVVCKGMWDGKETLGLRLNWEKRYITLSPVATLLGLAFKVFDPDHLLGEKEELGITCALIPTSLDGVSIGTRHLPLTSVFMNGPTWGKDVFIPLGFIIGGAENVGKGWRMLMNCLSVGRSISLPALSTGAGKLSALSSGAYARVRQQFGVPIGQFEGIQEALGHVGGLTYLLDAGRLFTAGLVDRGLKPSVPSAILKYHNTEIMRTVIGHAMDIHAGRAVIAGPRNYIASVYQAIPISITVEGANILTRSLMIFGQGGIRCHPFILKEMKTIEHDNEESLVAFDDVFFQHFKAGIQMAARSLVLGLTHSAFGETPKSAGNVAVYYKHLSRLSSAFFLLANVTMAILGGKLKFKESTSARLGDILSYLYLASTALKHYHDEGQQQQDRVFLDYSVQYCLYKIQEAMLDLLNQFPIPVIGFLLKIIVMPFGALFKKPLDKTLQGIVRQLMQISPARERLVEGVYYNLDPKDPIGKMENAFRHVLAAEHLEKKVKSALRNVPGIEFKKRNGEENYQKLVAQKIFTAEEAKQLQEKDALVWDAIQVDDFEWKDAKLNHIDRSF